MLNQTHACFEAHSWLLPGLSDNDSKDTEHKSQFDSHTRAFRRLPRRASRRPPSGLSRVCSGSRGHRPIPSIHTACASRRCTSHPSSRTPDSKPGRAAGGRMRSLALIADSEQTNASRALMRPMTSRGRVQRGASTRRVALSHIGLLGPQNRTEVLRILPPAGAADS
jgi:hypothetical protein